MISQDCLAKNPSRLSYDYTISFGTDHSITIDNGINADIMANQNQHFVGLMHPECLMVIENHDSLYIGLSHKAYNNSLCSRQFIHIYTSDLQKLTLLKGGKVAIFHDYGSSSRNFMVNDFFDGIVIFHDFKAQFDKVIFSGDGQVNIDGLTVIKNLFLENHIKLHLQWLTGNLATINIQGQAQAFIAGAINKVYIHAIEQGYVDARYLRGSDVFVRTEDKAEAFVFATKELYAQAKQKSNIYYFSKPGFIAPYSQLSGNVLPMTNIPGALLNFHG